MALFNFHHLFHHIAFKKADPLGDGLREEIEAEQLEPEAIRLEEDYTEEEQEAYWRDINSEKSGSMH